MSVEQKVVDQFVEDANESTFQSKQLTYVDPTQREVLYPDAVFANGTLPISRRAAAGDVSIAYYVYDKQGLAKARATYAKDAPKVNVSGKEVITKIIPIQGSMDYNINELNASAKANVDLIGRKRRALESSFVRELDRLVALGESDLGITGMTNHPNMTTYTIPNGAAAASEWSTKTPQEIIADVNGMVQAMVTASKGVHKPNMIMLPSAQYELIAGLQLAPESGTSVLQFLENRYASRGIEFVESARLIDAGAGNDDMIIALEADPDNFEIEISQDFETFPVNQDGALFEQQAHMRTPGIMVYRPLAFVRGEGI